MKNKSSTELHRIDANMRKILKSYSCKKYGLKMVRRNRFDKIKIRPKHVYTNSYVHFASSTAKIQQSRHFIDIANTLMNKMTPYLYIINGK